MLEEENQTPENPIDPLTVGELITLKEAAKLAGLSYNSLRDFAWRGRLKTKKVGPMYLTTMAAVGEYLHSRHRGRRTDLLTNRD